MGSQLHIKIKPKYEIKLRKNRYYIIISNINAKNIEQDHIVLTH